jgi:transposase InsO family protein
VAERTRQNQRLTLEVSAIHAESRGRYGSPRVHAELRERGRRIGRKRVARLMRAAGLRARAHRRFRCTTDSRHAMAIKGNLLARRFVVSAPNTGWVSDITYLWTLEGWLYLAVILDLFSRRVVGWSLSERLERKLALECTGDGTGRATAVEWNAASLGPRQPIRQSEVSATAGATRNPEQHERHWKLLGQCGGRELLRHSET